MHYHILQQEPKGRTARVVFHVPVPATGKNEADLTWRDAVVLDQGGSGQITSILTNIEPTEDTQLKAGEIVEQAETVRFSSVNLTPAQKKAEIEARFNKVKISKSR